MTAFGTFAVERIGLAAESPGAFCVEASAGTGKTYSITGLVLRLVCEEALPLDTILVVTFTRAAAAELRGRIGERLANAERDLEVLARAVERDGAGGQAWLRGQASPVGDALSTRLEDDFVQRWAKAALQALDHASLQARLALWLERVRRARQRVDAATFTTIHAFCQRMLEWHAFESDQPLGVGFVEDEKRRAAELVNDLWGECVESIPPSLLGVVALDNANFAAAVDEAVRRREVQIAGASEAAQDADDWRAALDASMGGAARVEHELRALVEADEAGVISFVARVLTQLTATGFKAVSPTRGGEKADPEALLHRISTALQTRPPDQGLLCPEVVRFFGVCSDGVLEESLKRRSKVDKDEREALLQHAYRQTFAEMAERLGGVQDAVIVAACREARRRFVAKLAERSETTFNDLVLRLAERIRDEARVGAVTRPLTEAVRTRFRAALIDEFQDTDDAQWTLFRHTFLESSAHRLFLIGDPKQAIYRFRGADIHTYLQARQRVHAVARERLQARGASEETLARAGLYTMTRNFRSDGALLVAFNRLMGVLQGEVRGEPGCALDAPVAAVGPPGTPVSGFFDAAPENPSGIDYILVDWQKPEPPAPNSDCVTDASAPSSLRFPEAGQGAAEGDADGSSTAPPGERAVTWTDAPLVMRPVAVFGDTGEKLQLENKEACKAWIAPTVAADIRRLLESGMELRVKEGEAWVQRPVGPGDIAVLARTARTGAGIARQLRQHGIPSVVMSGELIWGCDEAEELVLVMEALLSPGYVQAVVRALSTPLLSVAPTLLAAFGGQESELPERWMDVLAGIATTWERRGLLRMVSALLELRVCPATGLPLAEDASPVATRREALLRFNDGERRLTNLMQLVELLHAEAASRFLGPAGQLDLLRSLRSGDDAATSLPDDPRKQRLDTDDQGVRITTVHGSKGLEYPIVFLPDFGERKAVTQFDTKAPLVVAGAGGAMQGDGASRFVLYPTQAILKRADTSPSPEACLEQELLEESRRLLYVALTRAEHQVVLYVPDWKDRKTESTLENEMAALTQTPLGALLAATPRVQRLLGKGEAYTSAAQRAAAERGDNDERLFAGDACLALAKAVNPRGTNLFAVPRVARTRPLPPETRWVPAEHGSEQPLEPALVVERARFYAPDYRMASFSSLASGAAHGATSAHDEPADAGEPEGSVTEDAPERAGLDELLAAPEPADPVELVEDASALSSSFLLERAGVVGRDFGTLIHEILEVVDFDAPSAADPLTFEAPHPGRRPLVDVAAHALRRFGFQLSATHLESIATDLHAFLNAPLGGMVGATSLARIPRARRIDELEFLLPVPERFSKEALVAAFRAGGPPAAGTSWQSAPGAWEAWLAELETLRFDTFHGYLQGFIDLVFATDEAPARLHLLDYKTNRLHTARTDTEAYAQPALVRAMVSSRYVLQYHLYLVALYRLQRQRLGRAFCWDTHQGGVWYPFLRGVQAGTDARGDSSALRPGIFYDRPPRERIEALDALFQAARPHAGSANGSADGIQAGGAS